MTLLYDVDEILTKVGFTKQDIAKVKKGYVVNSVSGIETLTDSDLATMIAFETKNGHIDAFEHVFLESPYKMESDSTIQQMVVDIDHDGDGSLDFSSVKLLPNESVNDMIQTYLKFQGGDELNLSQKEIDMFQAIDNKNQAKAKEQVEMVLSKVLQGRLEEYQQSGLEGISPYLRKGGKIFYPGKELQEKTEKSQVLHQHAKEFSDYVLSWPSSYSDNDTINDINENAKETYGWINYNINDKPSIALYHRIIHTDKEKNMKYLMNRTFYVSCGHNSVQQMGFAVPTNTSTSSMLLAFSSRTSTDAVTGFGGSAKRALGSRIMGGRIAENMEALRKITLSKSHP
jgi:hypothetical protein